MDRDLGKFSDEQLCSMAASGDDSAMAELISRITPLAGAKAGSAIWRVRARFSRASPGPTGRLTPVCRSSYWIMRTITHGATSRASCRWPTGVARLIS